MNRIHTALAGITIRLLAFNILIVFLPIAGILSLGTYERQLLASLEGSLVQQGRVLAAALEDAGPALGPEAKRLIMHLRQRHDSRLRVVDAKGRLLADSSRLAAGQTASGKVPMRAVSREPPTPPQRIAQDSFLYRLGSLPVRAWRKILRPPSPPADSDEYYGSADTLLGPEVADALSGSYGAATRISKAQQSVTLYSAIPILENGRPAGAVVVSQSTYRILNDLYSLRLDVFRLFLWSVATSIVLSLLLSATVTIPIRRLRDKAHGVIDENGRLTGTLKPLVRRDEIGDLSRSLGLLTERLRRHVRLVETFASDVSHELRNPLAAIRSALELAQSETDTAERRELLSMAMGDVNRMERLLSGVREISLIDSDGNGGRPAGSADDPPVTDDVRLIAERVIGARRIRNPSAVAFRLEGLRRAAAAPPRRVIQVLENLIDNAVSFSPPGGCLLVEIAADGRWTILRVSDEGPGIPVEHLDRIFERFFSFRPGEEKGDHAGLGLAIVKSIAEGCGGAVRGINRPGGGACFEVRLPAPAS